MKRQPRKVGRGKEKVHKEPLPIFLERIWRDGCGYIVGKDNEFCIKCGHCHNQTAYESGYRKQESK